MLKIQCDGQYSVAVLRSMSRQLTSFYLHTDLSHEQSKKLLRAAYLTNKARSLLEEIEADSVVSTDACSEGGGVMETTETKWANFRAWLGSPAYESSRHGDDELLRKFGLALSHENFERLMDEEEPFRKARAARETKAMEEER